MDRKVWAGVDIGGTKTAVVLSLTPPEILSRIEFATEPERGPKPAVARIKVSLHAMLAAQGLTPASLRAIGVSCGGPLDRNTGVVQAPPNLSTWIDVPIVDILAGEFACPTRLENDANAGALAEHRFGAGQGLHNIVFLTMGTGFGAGIVLNDRLYCGTTDSAGEIGHVRLTRTGPVGFHKAGSAEGWASGGGMAQIAASALRTARRTGRKTILLDDREAHSVTAREVGVAALAGDAVARRIVTTSGKKLGMALAILVDLLNPECIAIGGLAMRLGELILAPARAVLAKEALQPAVAACRVVPAMLGERIGDVAALCIAMDAVSEAAVSVPRQVDRR
jgi:glucokinase